MNSHPRSIKFKSQHSAALVGSLLLAACLVVPLFTIPRPSFVSSIPWKVELLISLFTIAALAAAFLNRRTRFQIFGSLSYVDLLLAGFIFWSALSTTWSVSPESAIHHTLVWSLYLIVFIAARNFLAMEKSSRALWNVFALVTLVLGIGCLFDYSTLVDFAIQEGTLRIRYAKYAEMLAVALPVLIAASLYARSLRHRAACASIAALAWFTIMFSLSKGAFIAASIGVVLMFAAMVIIGLGGFRRRAAAAAAIWVVMTLGVQLSISRVTSIPATTEYISGTADPSRSTTTMRAFTWNVAGTMVAANALTGVGGDNFGIAFNAARARYAVENPADPGLAIGEDFIFERAHNEFLQVAAELGITGLALFAAAFGLLAFRLLRLSAARRGKLSPMLIASASGMTAFFISSLFSSFSFRAAQNGIVFFLVMALAANEMRKAGAKKPRRAAAALPSYSPRPAFAAAILLSVFMLAFAGSKGASQFLVYQAQNTRDIDTAESALRAAKVLDRDNAGASMAMSSLLASKGQWDLAAQNMHLAVRGGAAVSITYARLADNFAKAGDHSAALRSFEEALAIFPRSSYLRVRYALMLKSNGRTADAEAQMTLAREGDERQANGWHALITEGDTAAHYRSLADRRTAAPPELKPEGAVHEYLGKAFMANAAL